MRWTVQPKDDKAKEEPAKTPSILGSQYSMPLDRIPNVEAHIKLLTMTPKDQGGFGKVESFDVYDLDDQYLHVPRFYGLTEFGAADQTSCNAGLPLDVPFVGTLDENQAEAEACVIKELTSRGGALLLRKPGGGKTVLSIKIACALKRRTIVFVHTAALGHQWEERIRTFAPEASIGRLQQNKVQVDADFVIATLQSVASRDYGSALDGFGLAVFDETHHIGAKVFFSTLKKIRPAMILGVTATPDRKDGLTKLLFFGIGDIAHRDAGNDVERVRVTIVRYTRGAQREKKCGGRPSLPLMIGDLVKDERRTAMICRRAMELYTNGRFIIVLSHQRAHLDALSQGLQTAGVKAEDIAFFIGGMSAKEQAAARERRVILATYSMAKEGFDVKRLDAEILATPLGDVEQAVGRVQRPCAGKPEPIVLDILDPYSIMQHTGRKRKRFYESKNFTINEVLE